MADCRDVLFRNSDTGVATPATLLKLEGKSTANIRCEFPIENML